MRRKKMSKSEWIALLSEKVNSVHINEDDETGTKIDTEVCYNPQDYETETECISEEVVEKVWDGALRLIISGVHKNPEKKHFIPGFGTFFVSTHRGHPLNLGSAKKQIGDYLTFKFKVSDDFKKRVLEDK